LNAKILFLYVDISGERLWVELKRIAEGRNAGPVLKVMLEQDTSQYLGMSLFYRIS
jgi:tRNA nucleotidyltransferase/poly(A) polymerase